MSDFDRIDEEFLRKRGGLWPAWRGPHPDEHRDHACCIEGGLGSDGKGAHEDKPSLTLSMSLIP
jgi:hypothetical protein